MRNVIIMDIILDCSIYHIRYFNEFLFWITDNERQKSPSDIFSVLTRNVTRRGNDDRSLMRSNTRSSWVKDTCVESPLDRCVTLASTTVTLVDTRYSISKALEKEASSKKNWRNTLSISRTRQFLNSTEPSR